MKDQIVIFFDGECILCSSWIQWLIKKDHQQLFSFCPLQSKPGREIIHQIAGDTKRLDTVVLVEKQRCYIKSSAALRIFKHLPFPYTILFIGISIPKPIRNWCYGYIAKHRYKWWGKNEHCMIPNDKIKDRFLTY